MIGMSKNEVMAAMDKLDHDKYEAILLEIAKPLQVSLTPSIQTVGKVFDNYMAKIVRPFIADLIELNNAKIEEDLKQFIQAHDGE